MHSCHKTPKVQAPQARSTAANRPAASKRRSHPRPGHSADGASPRATPGDPGRPRCARDDLGRRRARRQRPFVQHERHRRGPPRPIGPQPRRGGRIPARGPAPKARQPRATPAQTAASAGLRRRREPWRPSKWPKSSYEAGYIFFVSKVAPRRPATPSYGRRLRRSSSQFTKTGICLP